MIKILIFSKKKYFLNFTQKTIYINKNQFWAHNHAQFKNEELIYDSMAVCVWSVSLWSVRMGSHKRGGRLDFDGISVHNGKKIAKSSKLHIHVREKEQIEKGRHTIPFFTHSRVTDAFASLAIFISIKLLIFMAVIFGNIEINGKFIRQISKEILECHLQFKR